MAPQIKDQCGGNMEFIPTKITSELRFGFLPPESRWPGRSPAVTTKKCGSNGCAFASYRFVLAKAGTQRRSPVCGEIGGKVHVDFKFQTKLKCAGNILLELLMHV